MSLSSSDPFGEPWEQAVAILLVAVVDQLVHESPAGTVRHRLPNQALERVATVVSQGLPMDSLAAVEALSHISNISALYRDYWNRLHPGA